MEELMTTFWCQAVQLAANMIKRHPSKIMGKLLFLGCLLCAAVSASNSVLAQTACPAPWAMAKNVYGQVTLKSDSPQPSTANGETQTINQTETGQYLMYPYPLGASCSWLGGRYSLTEPPPIISINDSVEYPCPDGNGMGTDSWVSDDPIFTAIKLEFVSNDTYRVAIQSDVAGAFTSGGCSDGSSDHSLIDFGPPVDSTDLFLYSSIQSLPSPAPALITGSSEFSAVPRDVDEDFNVTAQPAKWILSWSFSPVPDSTVDDDCNSKGSTIGCRNQSLGEDIPVSGTPFTLHYQSDRQLGRGGADPFAISDAQGLGGWTLSVHHVLEPQALKLFCIDGSCTPASLQPKALYLGDGRMRSAAKVQAPVKFNGKLYLTSEDGSNVYAFDASSGRHLQTLRPLTGAVLYTFGYDNSGQLDAVTDAYGNVTRILRDAKEHPTAIVSPYGQMTTLLLDGHGYLSRITDPAGKNILLVHSPTGLLTSMTNASGNTSIYRYDTVGRLLQDSDPAGGFTKLNRTDIANGYEVVTSTALGVTSTFKTTFSSKAGSSGTQAFTNTEPCGAQATDSQTQALNRLSKTESLPDGSSSSTTVGSDPRWGIQVSVPTSTSLSFGNLIAKTSQTRTATLGIAGNPFSLITQTDTDAANGRVYTSTFTAFNRTYTNTSPVGRKQLVTLDTKERITSTQLGTLLPTYLAYDGRGRLSSVRQGTRNETLTYDTNGYLASFTNPLGQKTTFINDAVGHRLTTTLADGRILRYGYDANGNLISVTPPGRSAHDFSFNAVNLPSSYTPPVIPGTGATRYSYDADRRLSLVTQPDGETLTYKYDHAGRLSLLVTPTATLTYGYSPTTCNLISAAIAGGEGLTYGYVGPLLTATTWKGTVAGNVSRVYNNNFWVASRSIGGGTTVDFTYDNDGLINKAGALTLNRSATDGLISGTTLALATDTRTYDSFGALAGYTASYKGTPIYNFTFTPDNLGRIAKKSETIGGQTTTYGYDYDFSGRLLSVLQNSAIARSYTYDGNSNRLTATAGTVTTKSTYDAQDRLLTYGSASYTYSANGELASKSVGALKTTYQYDMLGNLLTVTLANGKKISYVIDPQNRRTGKKVNGTLEAGFLYDDDRVVGQLNAGNAIVSQFIYASEENVPDYMVAGGVTYRIFSDQLGSPRLVVNASSGQIEERIDYDEFGNVISDTNPGFQPFGFAGGLYDQDTKLVRFGARDYDPSIGRWTAKDPILFAGRDTNLFGYVLDDPVNGDDQSGLDPQAVLIIDYANIKVSRQKPDDCSCRKELIDTAIKTAVEALKLTGAGYAVARAPAVAALPASATAADSIYNKWMVIADHLGPLQQKCPATRKGLRDFLEENIYPPFREFFELVGITPPPD
jgi:RHS repeat-associated protein